MASALPAPFEPFGADHVAALIATAIAAVALTLTVRRGRDGVLAGSVRGGLVAVLLGGTAATLFRAGQEAPLSVWDFVPLHLCDFLIFVAVAALVTRSRPAAELLYFWAAAGTFVAMIGPDVGTGFPDWRFLAFFGLHGAVVVSAAVVTFGLGRQPGPGAPMRVLLLTNAYAAVATAVNLAFGTNFLYLCAKPRGATLLDWLGPWPVYIVAAEVLALGLFVLLDLPFRTARRRRMGAAAGTT
jgi:hypothetical integral membrane protein (TIGR02206 family)